MSLAPEICGIPQCFTSGVTSCIWLCFCAALLRHHPFKIQSSFKLDGAVRVVDNLRLC